MGATENPTEIHDWRNPAEWPGGAKPVTQKVQVRRPLPRHPHRLPVQRRRRQMDGSLRRRDPRRQRRHPPRQAQPACDSSRTGSCTRATSTTGSATPRDRRRRRRLLRPLARHRQNGTANAGPYQLKHAATPRKAPPTAAARSTRGTTTPATSRASRSPATAPAPARSCNQLFAYDWDEVGRLVKARRWDGTPGSIDDALPDGRSRRPPRIHLRRRRRPRRIKEAVDDLPACRATRSTLRDARATAGVLALRLLATDYDSTPRPRSRTSAPTASR